MNNGVKLLLSAILIIATFAFTSNTYAQTQQPYQYLRKWDVELGGGASLIFDKCGYDKMKTLGPSFYAELRHNPSTHPLKLGGQLSLTMNQRGGITYGLRDGITYMEDNSQQFVSWNALALAELPFFLTNRAEMYVSAGVGLAGFFEGNDKAKSDLSFCFMPRVGVDFNHRIRLGVYYKAERKQFSHLGINIGFIIGGGQYARPERSTFIGAGAGVSF